MFERLIKIASKKIDLPRGSHKHFSFILRRNTILSYGVNNENKTCPLGYKAGSTYFRQHSEAAAIRRFPNPLEELEYCRMVNIRLSSYNGQIQLSKPCKFCQTMLGMFNLKQVYYSDNTGNFIELI